MEKPWKVVLAFVAVFMAGSVFGGFFALRIGHQVAQRERPRPVPVVGQPMQAPPATQLLRRFAERLELSGEQRDKLRPILLRAEEQIGRIRHTSVEQTDAVLRRMQQEFRSELTPDQVRLLDRMQRVQNENLRRERMKRQQPGFVPQPNGPNRPGGGNRPFFPPNGNNRPFPNPGPKGPPPPYGPPNRQFEGPRPPNPPPENVPPREPEFEAGRPRPPEPR